MLGSRAQVEPAVLLKGETVYLRYPLEEDFEAWAGLRAQSRAHLEPWEPVWPQDDLTRTAYRRRMRRYQREVRDDLAHPLFIFAAHDDALLGACTLSNVRRGVSQACSMGYWIGARYAGRGFMTAAVRRVIPFVFDDLRLHRIEAACIPANLSSQAVLRRCGFTEEGRARRYLKIAGEWQDHILFGLVEDDPRL